MPKLNQPVLCRCGQKFKTREDMRLHIKMEHNDGKPAKGNRKKYAENLRIKRMGLKPTLT